MRAVFLTTSSPSCNQIWKSLQSAGHDVVAAIVVEGINQQQVIDTVRGIKPDFAVFIGSAHDHVLSLDTLGKIADIVPFIHLCCDGGDEPWHRHLRQYESIFRLQVNMDGCDAPGCMTSLELMDDRDFSPIPWQDRDIRFGMSGGLSHGRRAEFITAMQRHGLQLFKGTAPYADAAKLMCRIKIMFDHGMTGSGGSDHCNCRIIEAGYAGCALFENVESPLHKWLTPGVEYFAYRTVDDLDQLLQIPDKLLQSLAEALHTRIMRDYSPKPAWDRILKQADLLS